MCFFFFTPKPCCKWASEVCQVFGILVTSQWTLWFPKLVKLVHIFRPLMLCPLPRRSCPPLYLFISITHTHPSDLRSRATGEHSGMSGPWTHISCTQILVLLIILLHLVWWLNLSVLSHLCDGENSEAYLQSLVVKKYKYHIAQGVFSVRLLPPSLLPRYQPLPLL